MRVRRNSTMEGGWRDGGATCREGSSKLALASAVEALDADEHADAGAHGPCHGRAATLPRRPPIGLPLSLRPVPEVSFPPLVVLMLLGRHPGVHARKCAGD